jgi:hypothetical protein
MVMSGWQTYNASPIFGFEFPSALTLGGWLAGALLWHFAASRCLRAMSAFRMNGGRVRPIAACRALEKRTFANFSVRPEVDTSSLPG